MLEDDVECQSLTIISIDYLLVYENKYYVQVYLDKYAYKTKDKERADYTDDNLFSRLDFKNAVLRQN